MTTDERFDAKVAHEPNTGCWLWTACLSPEGYGRFRGHQQAMWAHRFSWERKNGPVPPGLELDHLCRVRCCVNPDHLRAVTHRENMLAPGSLGFSAVNARKTHCLKGHLYDFTTKHGQRVCRACVAEEQRVYSTSHREAKRLYDAKRYLANREERLLYAANAYRAAKRASKC